jgi:uncharacterized protein (PEP-CTERM system associated)
VTRARCAFTLLILVQSLAVAGDLTINAGVSAELVDQQIKTKDEPKETINTTSRLIKPFAALTYEAKDFDVFFKGINNRIRQKRDDQTSNQDYTEYNYSGNYDIVNSLLSFNTSGIRSYTNNSLNSFLVDDFLLNSDSLNKITSDNASFRLNIRRGEYYGLSATTLYRHTTSERNEPSTIDESVFQNETYGLTLNAITGTNLDGARVSLSSNLNYSKRDSGEDFASQQVSISADIETYGDFGIALNSSYENNEFRTEFESESAGAREFSSVGAGLIWQPRNDRYIKILFNRSLTSSLVEGEEDEEDNYISYNIDWAFSLRTSIQGSFYRRFFGDAADLSFRHRTKHWQSSISYTEVVSSNSQLLNSGDVGLFICDNGSTDIADCRLSDTLEPELEQGEALQPFEVPNFEINDRIILRKSLTAQTAVTRKRTTLSLTAIRSESDEIEINRIYNVSTIRTSLNFAVSPRTSLQYAYSYAKTELDEDGELENATTMQHNIELRHKLSRRFTSAVSLSYLDRDGEITRGTPSLEGLDGPLTDRRITFRISYAIGMN